MAARKLLFSSAKLGIHIRERLHLEDVYEDDHELRLELLTLKDVRRANELLARHYSRYNNALVAMVENGRQCSESLIDVARLLRARGEIISEEELSQETVDKYLFSRELREVLVTVGRTERDVHDAFSAFSRAVELNMIKPRQNFTKSYSYGEFRQKKLHYKDVKRTFKAHQKNVDEEPGAVERFELAEARAAYEDAESQLRRYALQLEAENDESMRQTIANLVIQHHAALARALTSLEKILPLCRRHAVERGAPISTPVLGGLVSPAAARSMLSELGPQSPHEAAESTAAALLVARVWLLMYQLLKARRQTTRLNSTTETDVPALRTSADSDSFQAVTGLQGRVTGLEDSLRRERNRVLQLTMELRRKQTLIQHLVVLYWLLLAKRMRQGAGAFSDSTPGLRPGERTGTSSGESSAAVRLRRQLAALCLQATAWHALYRYHRRESVPKTDLSPLVESDLMRDLVRCREQCNRSWCLLLRERERRHADRRQMRCRLRLVTTCIRMNPLAPGSSRYLYAALHRMESDERLTQRGHVAAALDTGSVLLLNDETELEFDYVFHGAASQADVSTTVERLLSASFPATGQRFLFLASSREANAYTALGTSTAPGILLRWIQDYFQAGNYAPLAFDGREYHRPNAIRAALERFVEAGSSKPVVLRVMPASASAPGASRRLHFEAILYEAGPREALARIQRFAPFAFCIATVDEFDTRTTEILRLTQYIAEQERIVGQYSAGWSDMEAHSVEGTRIAPDHGVVFGPITPLEIARATSSTSATPATDVFAVDATSIPDDGEHDFNETSSLLRSYLFG
ncbi:hypothetical protein F1559_004737 [Cyanidiococcus yangmingshanensis]|uniref:Uncharacterized protein n=1 Tax=Cyanidiococcus yangmingshanensis TaxID=2690220 RepID=A0A7J7INB7_9RHOD|nr:hypothetical protein F1559_004737 [Cyanidiococcus yangmingshanensis]